MSSTIYVLEGPDGQRIEVGTPAAVVNHEALGYRKVGERPADKPKPATKATKGETTTAK